MMNISQLTALIDVVPIVFLQKIKSVNWVTNKCYLMPFISHKHTLVEMAVISLIIRSIK